ncbi:MAG: tetratricopeptide repeat protein [Spirochaetaceae bacterium]|nr:tetratricopeptide repeat protein [Spirochaetaceae bacterium]
MKLKHDDPEYISAMRLLILGDWDKAEEAFLKSAETYRESAFIQLALGNIAYSRGKLDVSAEYYDSAIELKPDFSTAYYKKGVCLYRMGLLEHSLETFKKILTFPNQSHAMASYFIGLINNFLGRDNEAVEAFAELRQTSPESKIANFYMAQLLYKQHNFDEAVELLSELLDVAPQFAEVQFQMGKTLLAKHKDFEAIKYYKNAPELNPSDSHAKSALELLTDVQWP